MSTSKATLAAMPTAPMPSGTPSKHAGHAPMLTTLRLEDYRTLRAAGCSPASAVRFARAWFKGVSNPAEPVWMRVLDTVARS